jgi:hypothetical protein
MDKHWGAWIKDNGLCEIWGMSRVPRYVYEVTAWNYEEQRLFLDMDVYKKILLKWTLEKWILEWIK